MMRIMHHVRHSLWDNGITGRRSSAFDIDGLADDETSLERICDHLIP
jgi:hypothetical protein